MSPRDSISVPVLGGRVGEKLEKESLSGGGEEKKVPVKMEWIFLRAFVTPDLPARCLRGSQISSGACLYVVDARLCPAAGPSLAEKTLFATYMHDKSYAGFLDCSIPEKNS